MMIVGTAKNIATGKMHRRHMKIVDAIIMKSATIENGANKAIMVKNPNIDSMTMNAIQRLNNSIPNLTTLNCAM